MRSFMIRIHLMTSVRIAIVAVIAIYAAPVTAEWYVAGMAGGVFPTALSNVKEREFPLFNTPSGTRSSDLSLSRSIMGGAKVGYFFERIKWFGIEGEVYRYSPHFKEQAVTTVPSNGAAPTTDQRPGSHHIVTNANLNLVARAQLGALEPYLGGGVGAFLQQWNMPNRENGYPPLNISSGRTGFNAEAGMRYRVGQHVAAFTEYKFNHVRPFFDSPSTVQGTYQAHFLVFGVGYHF